MLRLVLILLVAYSLVACQAPQRHNVPKGSQHYQCKYYASQRASQEMDSNPASAELLVAMVLMERELRASYYRECMQSN